MFYVGIDVGADKKGQAVAVMSQDLEVLALKAGLNAKGLAAHITDRFGIRLIAAIDASRRPALPGRGRWGRKCEREILSLGVRPQWTPDKDFFHNPDPAKQARYQWMQAGFTLFDEFTAILGESRVIEVFPSASYQALVQDPPVKLRFGLLDRKHRVDQLDAVCCALTAWCFDHGRYRAYGDDREGVIIVPA